MPSITPEELIQQLKDALIPFAKVDRFLSIGAIQHKGISAYLQKAEFEAASKALTAYTVYQTQAALLLEEGNLPTLEMTTMDTEQIIHSYPDEGATSDDDTPHH